MEKKINKLVEDAWKILVLQADNPDADSLASALALEQLLGEKSKEVYLYCGVGMPSYLKYLSGWDRVSSELPKDFDLSIIVDASSMTLFEKLNNSGDMGRIAKKPCIVLDHHAEVNNQIPFVSVNYVNNDMSSTGELIYRLAKGLEWPIDNISAELIMTSILGDTQGLSNDLTTAGTYRVMAELVDMGANRPELEEKRRELSKMHKEIFLYKATLINRTEFFVDGKLAIIVIPNEEIIKYSPLYNPNALIQTDHLQTQDVSVSIAFKQYQDGKITAGIRCNNDAPIASELATSFGGGGHAYSAGFKITNNKSLQQVKSDCITLTTQLLDKLKEQ